MSRTPYSPFVLKATAPDPWKLARCVREVSLFERSKVPREVARGVDAAVPGKSDRFRRD